MKWVKWMLYEKLAVLVGTKLVRAAVEVVRLLPPRVHKQRQAPEPSDVKWENLDVTPTSRKLRRAVTSFVCFVLLILSFAIIYLAQTEQVRVILLL